MSDMTVAPPTTPDEVMLRALAAGASITNAAALAGCSTKTVARRLANPEFRSRLNGLRAEQFADVATMLRAELPPTIKQAIAIRDDPDVAAGTRLQACTVIVAWATKFHELTDLNPRLEVLELLKGAQSEPPCAAEPASAG